MNGAGILAGSLILSGVAVAATYAPASVNVAPVKVITAPISQPSAPAPAPTTDGYQWLICAQENQLCTVQKPSQVRYGANGIFSYRSVDSSIGCGNQFFGDPVYGVPKICSYRILDPGSAEWTNCATESQVCVVPGPTQVRYGIPGNYAYKLVSDHASCSNTVFGDPAYGIVKSCAYRSVASNAPAVTKNGVYVGNDPRDLLLYESWAGAHADGIQIHTGRAGWADWAGSIPWLINQWKAIDRTIYWSIPLMAEGATLAEVGAGRYDDHFITAAKQLVAGYPNSPKIYVRTGWEFNGNWQPWSAAQKEGQYIAAYRKFISCFRSVSDKFVFEWTPNIGDQGMNPESAYPGDDVVDVIGMDFYYDLRWNPQDPDAAWSSMVNQRYGLAWHQAFAALHKKPTAYSEWGVESNNDASYVRNASAWFKTYHVLYQNYWNSNAAFPGKLSDGQYPELSQPYRALITGA